MSSLKIIALTLLASCLGCSAHKQPLHMKGNVSLISYSENECSSLPDQRIKCNNVIFTLKAVRVDDWRRK